MITKMSLPESAVKNVGSLDGLKSEQSDSFGIWHRGAG